MPRKAMDKVLVTPELLQRQKDMRSFLRNNSSIEWRELKPHGFQINIGTIPQHLAEQFLEICYQTETKTE